MLMNFAILIIIETAFIATVSLSLSHPFALPHSIKLGYYFRVGIFFFLPKFLSHNWNSNAIGSVNVCLDSKWRNTRFSFVNHNLAMNLHANG